MTFLRMDYPMGWVFDQQPGKDKRVRMMEVKVEKGSWHYMVTAEHGIALRTRCSFSDQVKCGAGPLRGALIEATESLRIGETVFLKLKDSGRWVFDCRAGRKLLKGPLDVKTYSPQVKCG